MNREVHVRFWEGVGVRFPRATRLSPSLRLGPGGAGLYRTLPGVLQRPPPPFEPRQTDPGRVLLEDPAGLPQGRLTPAGHPLIRMKILFKEPGPPLYRWRRFATWTLDQLETEVRNLLEGFGSQYKISFA
jgi:hypothetical protein